MALQQYHLGGTYYGYDPSNGQLVAFANMQQLQQYFPSGIQQNAPNLPVDPTQANRTPGTPVNVNASYAPAEAANSSSSPAVSAPQNIRQSTSTQPSVLFSAYGETVYSNAKVTQGPAPDGSGRQAVIWTNPDGSYIWETPDGSNVKQYAPQYYSASPSTTTPPQTPPSSTTPPAGQVSAQTAQTTSAQIQSAPLPNSPFAQEVQLDFSRGGQFLFRFPSSHGNTVYLYDKNDNMLVPFTSAQGFQALTGMDPTTALNEGYITDATTPPTGSQVVPDQYGFDNTGNVSAAGLQYIQSNTNTTPNSSGNPGGYTFYGQPQDASKEQVMATQLFGNGQQAGLLAIWADSGAINPATLTKIGNDPTTAANLIHAATYGGYTLNDVFMYVKAIDLGQTPTSISQTQAASDYYNTPQYAQAKNNSQLAMPQNISANQSLLNSPLAAISPNAFATLVQPVDINAPNIQQQALSLSNQAADLALQLLNANTTQEKAVADQNYQDWKSYIENIYGFALANDAVGAWGQLSQMSTQAEQGYTSNSGALNAAQDLALNQRRIYDQQLRTSMATQEQMQARNFYLSSATADQIAALTPKQRQDWGLTPSSDLMNYLNGLSSQYPNMSADEINQIKNMFIDQNGNMRSQLYSNLYKNQYNNIYGPSGKLEQGITKILGQNQVAAQQAGAAYDTTDAASPFLRSTGTPSSQPQANPSAGTQPVSSSTTSPTPASTSQQPSGLQMPPGYSASNAPTATQTPSQPPQGLQMPPGYAASNPAPSSSSSPTFTSYVKTANDPTVYGVTPTGQNVAFENSNQFLNTGASWGDIKTVNTAPTNPINYSQYQPTPAGA